MSAREELPAWLISANAPPLASHGFESLPAIMRNARRWLAWKLEPNSDPSKKPRKVPHYADGTRRSGELDGPEDCARLANFADALLAYQSGRYTGLGFALGPDGTGNVWQGIDLDDMPSRPPSQKLAGELPGYTEVSPSGNGMHAIGYGRPFLTLGSNASGIEAYSHGRYFTVTGRSIGIHPPVCLADFVESRLKPMHAKFAKGSATVLTLPSETVAPEVISDLRSALMHMRSDDRDLWVRMGHALKSLGEVGRGLWLEWSASSDKFEPAADSKTWDSFMPYRTGYQAVFAEAQRQGWLNPRSHAANSINGDLSSFQWSGNSEAAANPVEAQEWKFVPIDSLDDAEAELPHVVDLLVPRDEVTLLGGHGGGGKSYVAQIVGAHTALGRPFGALPTTQCNVLFFSAEDGAPVLRQRLAKICRAYHIDPADLEGRLHLLDASDIDPALHREQRVTINGRQKNISETPLINDLAALVQKLDAGLVIIDNASDAYDGDEIKRAHVRTFIRSLRQRIARPGRAVILLAHVNKASAIGGKSAGTEDYSGSTAWHNSVRSRVSLTADGENAIKIEHMKANLGRKADPVRLEWVGGVPMVQGMLPSIESAAAAYARAQDDKAALVAIIQDFDRRGETVTTSVNGPCTVFKLLRNVPGFPKGMASDQLTTLLRELETEGRIFRRMVRSADRKRRLVFTCKRDDAESAPNATA